MNIAILEGSKHWTGGAKRAFLLAKELKKNGHVVIIVCPPKALLGDRAREDKIAVRRLFPIGSMGILSLKKIYGILKNYRIDIVDIHSSVFYRTGGLAGKLAGAKVVFTRNVAFRKGKLKRVVNRLMYALSDKIIAVSNQVKIDLVSDFALDEGKVEVIVDGIDTDEFYVPRLQTEKIRDELGLGGCRVAGVVTRMDKTKGHRLLLESIPHILARLKDVKFVITGTGKIENEIKACAKSLKLDERVIFTGFRKDIPEIISAVDITIMPSINEGLGMCILESLAGGKPVVAFNTGGIPEVVIDGITGVLVVPFTAEALANGIIRIFDSDYRKLGEKGKDLVSKKFSLSGMAEKTLKVYEELL